MLQLRDFSIGQIQVALGIGVAAGTILCVVLLPLSVPAIVVVGVVGLGVATLSVQDGLDKMKNEDPEPPKPSSSLGDEPDQDQLNFPDDSFGNPPDDIQKAIASGGDVVDFEVIDTSQIPGFPSEVGAGNGDVGIPGDDGLGTGSS